jgi:zinc transport system permease protein
MTGRGITNMLESIPIIGRLLLVENGGVTFLDALPILQSGVIASAMVALLAGYLGIYVILKRIVFVSAALSQVSSLGIAFFFLGSALLGNGVASAGSLQGGEGFVSGPLLSSLLFGCVTASVLAVQVGEKKLTRESILGIGYALPAGLVFLILDKLAAETHDIENILFGNVIFVPERHLWLLAATLVVVFAIHLLLYKRFVYISFDPETAQATGSNVRLLNQLLFVTLAFTISVSIAAIGALPVFSFLVIPAASALMLTDRLNVAFLLSMVFGLFSALVGFYLSFVYSLPTGPAMLGTAGACLIPGIVRRIFGR